MKPNLVEKLEIYLQPTHFIDSDSPEVIKFAKSVSRGETTDIGKAIKLYYAVRDGIYYDPYRIDLNPTALKASAVLARKFGFCVPKAILLAALARAEGIPSRLGFADVKNHLSTSRLKQLIKTDVFVYHGYTELFLGNKWVKATPAFNLSLCERFEVSPLEFDGRIDSIFHEFSRKGNRHMEYLHDHGHFADLPYSQIVEAFKKHYPILFSEKSTITGNFEEEALADKKR
jgi:transglutaminase-like putative cysteine protease